MTDYIHKGSILYLLRINTLSMSSAKTPATFVRHEQHLHSLTYGEISVQTNTHSLKLSYFTE